MGDLTKHFSLSDFAVSSTYPEEARKVQFSETDKLKAFLLAQLYGEPLVKLLGYTPDSSSGKRTKELNKKLHGGKETPSGHLWKNFEAAWDLGMKSPGDFWKSFDRVREGSIYGELIIYLRANVAFNLHVALPSQKDDPSSETYDTLVCVEEGGKREYFNYEDWKPRDPMKRSLFVKLLSFLFGKGVKGDGTD